jgi:hypothetical protein
MSLRWVESTVPFLDEECVVDAIEALGVTWSRQGSRITFSQPAWLAEAELQSRHGAWILRRLAEPEQRAWESQLVAAYENARETKLTRLEDARRREEEARVRQEQAALVERRRKAIVEKARKKGYSVKERREGNEIRLVLVRRTY